MNQYLLSFNHICTVAKIEFQLIQRTIVMKFLWVLFLLVTAFFILFSHIGNGLNPLAPGSLAIKAYFWFSLSRILLSSFIAPVFVHDDKRQDTFQSITARPFNNTSYIVGKLLGFTAVMVALDYCCMLMFYISSFLLPETATSIWPYFLYPIIITIPLCVFLFGVNVLAAKLFYPLVYAVPVVMALLFLPFEDLESSRYLDLGAITIPLVYSMITGFHHMSAIIIQRLIYMFAGIGLTLASIILSRKARKSGTTKHIYVIVPLLALCTFASILFAHINRASVKDDISADVIQLLNNMNYQPFSVESYDITVIHKKNAIDVISHMNITNPHDVPIETIVFMHNIEFKTTNAVAGDRIKSISNELNTIVIELNSPLEPHGSMDIEITDQGSIDLNSAYYTIPAYIKNMVNRSGLTALGKQLAYIDKEYVLLPAEVNWYPVPYNGYSPSEPGYTQRNLSRFSLEVITHDDLVAVSQGEMTEKSTNTYLFKPEIPLTQISLAIGPYQKISLGVDDIEYSYWWIGKNRFIDSAITSEDFEKAIRSFKNDLESTITFAYPFKRYRIIETPAHFFGYQSPLSTSSPYDQPEIRFIPESTIALSGNQYTDGIGSPGYNYLTQWVFRALKVTDMNTQKIMGKIYPLQVMFRSFSHFMVNPHVNYSNIMTQYSVFARGPVSYNDYFNLLANNWLRNKFFSYGGRQSTFTNYTHNYRTTDTASFTFLTSKSLNDIVSDDIYFVESNDILNMASETYFNMLAAKNNTNLADFELTLLTGFESQNIDTSTSLSQLCKTDALELLHGFANQKGKAYYIVSDQTVSQHVINDHQYTNFRFTISNPTPYHGLVVAEIPPNHDKEVIYLAPYSEKEVGLSTDHDDHDFYIQWLPFGVGDSKSYSSYNTYNIPVSVKTLKPDQIDFFDGIRDVRVGTVSPVIIKDNLDEECRIVSTKGKSFIRRFIENRNNMDGYLKFVDYKGLEDAPDTWTLAKSIGESQGVYVFYGKYSSCYYTKAGDGESAVEYPLELPETGLYEVYISSLSGDKAQFVRALFESGDLGETTVKVFAEDGIHEEIVDISQSRGINEWVYVGTYSFAETTAVVQITDKTRAKLVIADAVQLRKVE